MGCNFAWWAQNKAPFAEQGMGDRKARIRPNPAAPQHNVQVERAGAPALPTTLAAKLMLNLM